MTPPERPIDCAFTVPFRYRVSFTRGAFAPGNPALADALAPGIDGIRRRAVLLLDGGLAAARPGLGAEAMAALAAVPGIDPVGEPRILPGGEAAKSGLCLAEAAAAHAAACGIDRQSFLIAIGGGAFLDAVGLGCALLHRGARLLRMPSTVLAQNDAGIGVKNGVNAFGQKNCLGCFQPPFAVINDLDLLRTLPDRDWRAGVAEAVKVAAIRDAEFLARLEADAPRLARRDEASMEALVRRCASLHLAHIASSGDPFEFGSARPLDFGHWSAHWLEMASGGAVSHGEAVAIGIALDERLAARLGFLPPDARRLATCLHAAGLPLWHGLLERRDASGRPAVLEGLDRFREHLGGRLALTLPCPLGSAREVDSLDAEAVAQALDELKATWAGRPLGSG